MSTRPTLEDLAASGAHQKGHFRLSSGLHSADYLQCALYLAHPRRAESAGRALAQALLDDGVQPQIVASPALGGLILGHETARALDVPFLFTERTESAMALRRGFAVAPEQTVAVVEDVVTTGRSTREVVEVVTSTGGRVLAVGSLVNRSGKGNPFDPLPYLSLIEVGFTVWEPAHCPLCRDGVPITKPGSRPISEEPGGHGP